MWNNFEQSIEDIQDLKDKIKVLENRLESQQRILVNYELKEKQKKLGEYDVLGR